MHMKNKKKFSIKSRMIVLLLICWFLPLIILTTVNAYYMFSDRFENKISREMQQLKFSDRDAIDNLDEVIEASREATYDGFLIGLYEKYMEGAITKQNLVTRSSYYLRDNYSRNENIKTAVLWYREDPHNMECNTYNIGEGGTYGNVKKYWTQDHEKIMELSKSIGTRICFFYNQQRLYLIRNLYTPSYENVATLALCINQPKCFEQYYLYSEGCSITLKIDDCVLSLRGREVTERETGISESSGNRGYRWEDNKLNLYDRVNTGDYRLCTLVRYDDSSSFSFLFGFDKIFIAMVLCLIPLVILLLLMFDDYMTRPIHELMDGAGEIKKGNLGYQIPGQPLSKEFEYLSDSFNSMSKRLKYQFDHIYEEEVALRDARIKALQLQINPHFMNNTLEIINWEARLSGNEKVSKMIESLAVLMNAGMDRKKEPLVLLQEEMQYVNAYLYIISERFGSRLTVVNQIDESLMHYKVPRLILQPVIENAVEHGVARKGNGTIFLSGKADENYLYIDIVNEGELIEEEKIKIDHLLSENFDVSKESSGNIGISNVNQRLKMLFGETSGLKIEQCDSEHICAHLTIKI